MCFKMDQCRREMEESLALHDHDDWIRYGKLSPQQKHAKTVLGMVLDSTEELESDSSKPGSIRPCKKMHIFNCRTAIS